MLSCFLFIFIDDSLAKLYLRSGLISHRRLFLGTVIGMMDMCLVTSSRNVIYSRTNECLILHLEVK